MSRFLGWLRDRFGRKNPPAPPPPAPPGDEVGRLLSLCNAERSRRGLPLLTSHAALASAAQSHADWMARLGGIGHAGAGGSTPWDRAQAAGYPGWAVTEDVAAGQRTAEEAMASWMGSAGHAANVLGPQSVHAGFGVADDAGGVRYWCALFGRPG